MRTSIGTYEMPQASTVERALTPDDTMPPGDPDMRQVIGLEVIDNHATIVALRSFTISPAVTTAAYTSLRVGAARPPLGVSEVRAHVEAAHRRWPGPTDSWAAATATCRPGQ